MNSFSRALTPPFKIWKVLRYPSYLCLRLTIPVVDEEVELMRGWNQKLHVLQCLLTPIFTVFATNTAFITIKGNIGVVSDVSLHARAHAALNFFMMIHPMRLFNKFLFGGTKKTLFFQSCGTLHFSLARRSPSYSCVRRNQIDPHDISLFWLE